MWHSVDSPQFGHAEIDHVRQPCSDKAAADKAAAEKAAADKAAADKAAADKAAADKAAADIAMCSGNRSQKWKSKQGQIEFLIRVRETQWKV